MFPCAHFHVAETEMLMQEEIDRGSGRMYMRWVGRTYYIHRREVRVS